MKYPADAGANDPTGCVDPNHGQVGTLVRTGRHGQGHRWQARWVGDGAERSKSFARKADAERHLRGVVADLATGTYADPRRSAVTFGSVAESWLATKEASREPKTVASYQGLLDVMILPKWRDGRLRDIDHERLQTWITWLSTDAAARQQPKRAADANGAEQTGLSAARVIHAYQIARQVLAYAVRSKYLAVNAADGIELPRKPQGKGLALTHDQVPPRRRRERRRGGNGAVPGLHRPAVR